MDNNFYSDKEFINRRKEIQKKRAEKLKQQRKKALKNFSVFMAVVLIIVLIILSLTIFFPIKKITLKGDKTIYNATDIIKASGIEKGENIFMSGRGAEQKIVSDFPYISTAKISKKFPSEVVITLKNASVSYSYVFEKSYYLCDANNKLLEISKKPAKNSSLVVGLSPQKTEVGKQVEFENVESVEALFNIKKTLDTLKINIIYFNIPDTLNIKFKIDKNFTVLLGSSTNYEKKLLHLSEMLKNTEKGQKGTFDLSIWTEENPIGIFKKG